MPDGIRQFATPLTGQKKNNLQEKCSYNRIYQYGIKQEGTYIIMDSKVKDMTSGSPGKLILTFAIPLMLGNVFQQFYTMVDTMVVGQVVGVEALAALGATDWLVWLVLGVATGMTQGFSILVSQYYGAREWDKLKKSVAHS